MPFKTIVLCSLILGIAAIFLFSDVPFMLMYGSSPMPIARYRDIGRDLETGMSQEEVTRMLGRPHSIVKTAEGKVAWIYYTGINGYAFGIDFDNNNRIVGTWN